jgi:hypothetical protein
MIAVPRRRTPNGPPQDSERHDFAMFRTNVWELVGVAQAGWIGGC